MIKYDGGKFFGWQLQIGRRTIQGVLEEALKSLLKSDVRIPIHGSGRTDSGVHSWGQVAHADLDLNFNIEPIFSYPDGTLYSGITIINDYIDDCQ